MIEIPYEEYQVKMRKMDQKYIGEYTILGTQRPPKIWRGYDFTHTQRGLALYSNRLAVFVEVMTEDFRPGVPEGGFEQFVYVIDLDQEEAITKASVEIPGFSRLEGALSDGTLIFRADEPFPGIRAYRVVRN